MEHYATHQPKNYYTCVLPPQNDGTYYVYRRKRKQRPHPLQTLSDETVETIADSSDEIAVGVETDSAEEVLPDLITDLPSDIARDEFQNIQEESAGDEEDGKSIEQSNQRKNRELNSENPRSPRLPVVEEAQTTQSSAPTKRIDIQVLLNGVPVPQMQVAFINEKREALQSFVTDEQGGISANIGLNTLIKIGTIIIIPEKDTTGIVFDLATRQVTQVLDSPPAIEAIETGTEEEKAVEEEAGELEVPDQEEPVQIISESCEATAVNEEIAVVQEEVKEKIVKEEIKEETKEEIKEEIIMQASPPPQIKPARKEAESEKHPAKPAVMGGNIAGLSPLILLLFATPEVLKLLQNKK